jgi:hypothetical protein
MRTLKGRWHEYRRKRAENSQDWRKAEVINWKFHTIMVIALLVVGYYCVRWLYNHDMMSDSQQQTANVALNWGALVYAIYLTKCFADGQKRTKNNPLYMFMDEFAGAVGEDFKDPAIRTLYVRALVKLARQNRTSLERFVEAKNGDWDGIRTLGEALRESNLTKDDLRGFFMWAKVMGAKSEVHDLKNQLIGYHYDFQSMESTLNRILRVYHEHQKDVDQTITLVENLLPIMPAMQRVYGARLERAKTLTEPEKDELVKTMLRS